MYGKVFNSIYDGTLYGHWEAIVTMQQLIVLASPEGVVDMTPQAIAARTSIPFEIISKGLDVLAKPDPYTRTPGDEGRRIVLMDEHRPWGWRLVNHGKYTRLRNMEQKREADRVRIAEKRNQIKIVATESQMSPIQTQTKTHTQTKETTSSQARPEPSPVVENLPLREGGEYQVTQSLVTSLEPLYPAVDVKTTLREMRAWLLLNESRRKTRRGIKAFIGRWLQSEQEKHGG